MLYNQIKKCVNSGQNHVWVNLALPGQESEDSNGNYKVVADSKMTAQEMFDVLAENWEESYLKNELLTRMISVLAMDGVRRAFADYCEANPNATQDERDAKRKASKRNKPKLFLLLRMQVLKYKLHL